MISCICWRVGLKIENEANSNEHWAKKSNRHRKQKQEIKKLFLIDKPNFPLPVRVILTRIAPRKFDAHDNLRYSLKWIVDAIAENLTGKFVAGQADNCEQIEWDYHQERGKPREYGLRIEIYTK